MRSGKVNRAMGYIDEALIAGADVPYDNPKERRKQMKKIQAKQWVALAAALALVIGIGIFTGWSVGIGNAGAVVALDVNPGLEIAVDAQQKVVSLSAHNAAAEAVLADTAFLADQEIDLTGAVNTLVAVMVEQGYLSAEQNSVLISVHSKNPRRENELKDSVRARVGAILAERQIDASVFTQSFGGGASTEKLSAGKAALVEKILAAGLSDKDGVAYTQDTLASMNIHQLKLVLESKGLTVEGLTTFGTASEGAYIGVQAAKAAALAAAALTQEAVSGLTVEMDFEEDERLMVYEVEFVHAGLEYEYELDALSGRILEQECGPDREEDEEPVASLPAESITEQQAMEAVLAHSGLSEAQILMREVEISRRGDVYYYDIELESAEHEYEYTIHAQSGEVLSSHKKQR